MANSHSNSKYAKLPGVVFDQPDCFETPDPPKPDEHSQDTIGDQSDNVETITMKPKAAFEKFKDHNMISTNYDFSNDDGKPGYTYQTGSDEPETLLQKIERIKSELCECDELLKVDGNNQFLETVSQLYNVTNDLNKQIADITKDSSSFTTLVTDISKPIQSLQKSMKEFDIQNKEATPNMAEQLKDKGVSGDSAIFYELFLKNDVNKGTESYKVIQLEERIKKLENILGQDPTKLSPLTTQTNNKSVLGVMNILLERTSLLNSSNLDQIESRLVAVQQRLQLVSEKKTSSDEADKINKVDELYDIVKRGTFTSTELPQLVDHMITVGEVHKKALLFHKSLKDLDEAQQKTTTSLIQNEELLKQTQNDMKNTMEKFEKMVSSLEQRIEPMKSSILK